MKTKKQNFWLVTTVCIMTVLSAFSEEKQLPKTQSPTKSGNGILYSLEQIAQRRKRMPSKNIIELYYENGSLWVDSPIIEGTLSINVSNCEMESIGYVPSVSIGESVSIDLDCGVYSLSAFSSSGTEYIGELTVL